MHVSINNFIFKHVSAVKCLKDFRRKLHTIQSERFEDVYLKHWWKIVYTSVLLFDEILSRLKRKVKLDALTFLMSY